MNIHIISDAKLVSKRIRKLFPNSIRKKNHYCVRVLYGVRLTRDRDANTINCDIIERYEIISLIDGQEYYLDNTGSMSILLHQLGYHVIARFDLQTIDGEKQFTKSEVKAQDVEAKIANYGLGIHLNIKTTSKSESTLVVEDLCNYRDSALSVSCPIIERPTLDGSNS